MFSFPSWPRFPSVSLPAFIQRRFLSFLLKKAFGHLVKPGQFDPVQIDAQIGTGCVHVNDVELDHNAINKHLAESPLPFLLQAGSIGKVSVQIPWPNVLTAPLALSLSSLSLTFVHISGVNPRSRSSYARDDLAEPVTFMAESFVHDELSPQENEALLGDVDTDISPRCYIPGSIDPLFSTENLDSPSQDREYDESDEMKDDVDPSAQGISLIATFIERLLARFEFDISEIRIHVVFPAKAEFTLHLGEVIYRVEASPEPPRTPSDGGTEDGEVRVVKLTRASLFTRDLALSLLPRSSPSLERSVSPDSSSLKENDAMSQSLTPLLPSHNTCSLSPESTVYHSALSSPLSVSPEISPRAAERLAVEERIISVAQGSEPLIFRLVTPRLAIPLMQPDSTQVSNGKITSKPQRSVAKPRLSVTIGPIAVGLNPIHARSLMYLSSAIASSMPVKNSPDNSRGRPAASFDVACCIKCVTILLLPHPPPILDCRRETNEPLREFFLAHSATSALPHTAHLRLQFDDLEFISTTAPIPEETFSYANAITAGRKTSPHDVKDLLKASISEFSVFSVTESAGQDLLILPVLISDPNLGLQYDHDAKFPSFDVADRTVAVDLANPTKISQWRVRPSHKGRLHEGTPASPRSAKVSHVPTLRACLVSATGERPAVCDVNVVPLHLFVDVGVLEEVLHFLNTATSSSNLTVERGEVRSKCEDETPPATPRASGHMEQHSYRDDVKKGKTSEKPTLSDFTGQDDIGHSLTNNVETNVILRFMFLRFEVRAPTFLAQTGARSGAVVLDVRDVKIMQQRKATLRSRGRYGDDHKERGAGSIVLATLQFTHFLAAVVLPGASRSSSFLSIRAQEVLQGRPPSLENDPALYMFSPAADDPPLPSICLRSNPVLAHRPSDVTSPNVPSFFCVDADLPAIHVKLSKPVLDGLTFWADDVARCLYGDIEHASKSDASGRSRDPSMIGSRFFSKRTASTGSSESGDETRRSELVIKVSTGEALIDLLVPRAHEDGNARSLNMKVLDVDLLAEFRPEGRDETVITLGIMGMKLCDTSAMGSIETILGSTLSHDVIPASIKLRFTSVVDNDTATKESRLKLTISGFTYFLTPDIAWITDLGSFAKAPEGALESVIPSERTKLSIRIIEGSFHLMSHGDPGALVAYMGELELSTELVGESREITISSNILKSCILFIDDRNSSITPVTNSSNNSCVEYWKSSGYALLADVDDVELRLRHLSEPPVNTQLHVYGVKLKLHICADTIPAFGTFSDRLFSGFRSSDSTSSTKHSSFHVPQHQKRDDFSGYLSWSEAESLDFHIISRLAAVDEHAFRRVPDLGPAPDMIYDNLPKNLDYLDASFGAAAGLRELRDDDLFDFEPYEPDYTQNVPATILGMGMGIISNVGGETIRILDSQGIRVVEGHFENIPHEKADYPLGSADAKLSIRLWDCHLTVSLHDGYDWVRTRKTIEQEVKAIRRRLVKIRQLLASGQTADASIEETSAILFNSVSIGLPREAEELEPVALIAAIDKELGDDAASENASQSSWQSFKPQTQQETPRFTELRGRKLERSESSQIDFSLSGLQVDSDQYHPEAPLVSKLLVTVKDLEILDHMKTSTWKKFLTVLWTDFRGNVRETDSNMVRVELRTVHPVPDLSSEEGRLRMKVLPIKLHVDQDALDFMKKFFGFQLPGAVVADSAKSELYFQHVEVFPVDIKLDYKPKRVDYKALREGRTIELMNFFHFEGAEITLRHITLSGISGWGRLFDTLNDLWTPDVKANQLADIISGVSPVRSLVNVGSGVADLVLLPIAQYKKDKRVVRGVQMGTTSFVKSTAMEALKLGARLATGTQVILEQAENVLGGQGQFRDTVTAEALHSPYIGGNDGGLEVTDLISKYADQPQDLREGMESAYKSLSKNFNAAAQTILAVPMEVYERSGNEGPVRAIVRAVPIAVLKPMIGASEAVSKTLFGLRNTMDPEIKRENEAKYKQR